MIPYAEFGDEDLWGDGRTFRRLKDDLNRLWEQHAQSPLFRIVDADGRETERGDRFLQLVDKSVHRFRTERLAIFPAYMELMRVVSGTILEDELKPIYEKITQSLDRSEQLFLKRMDRKFFYFGKGMKSYRGKREVLDQVYTALVREQLLEVTLEKASGTQQAILRPLTLMMFNNGLYLTANYDTQDVGAPAYHFRIESLLAAEAVKGSSFQYPSTYDPAKLYDGQFGIIRGKEAVVVELDFAADPVVKRYVRDRRWTDSDEYMDMPDGTLRLKFKVTDLTEVRAWVLSFGASCRVVGPNDLKQQIVDAVTKMTLLYSA